MKFLEWTTLVREYAKIFYCWDDVLDDINEARQAYLDGVPPKEYVDDLAYHFSLDSYADLNFGKLPPGFDQARYNITP